MKFISPEECEKLRNAPDTETFSILLNEVLSRVCNAATEGSIRKIPEVVTRLVATSTATKAMTVDFYDKNKDFVDHKDIVNSVVQDIDSKNPEYDYAKMLEVATPIIKEKIRGGNLDSKLPCDLPGDVNLKLKGNGEI